MVITIAKLSCDPLLHKVRIDNFYVILCGQFIGPVIWRILNWPSDLENLSQASQRNFTRGRYVFVDPW